MSLSKKLTCKGTLRQVFYVSEAPSPPMIPSLPLPTQCVSVYSILIHTGKERTNQKEGLRGISSQSQVENTNMTAAYKIYKTPAKTTFRVWCLYNYLVHVELPKPKQS
jgi:hypothetical protein